MRRLVLTGGMRIVSFKKSMCTNDAGIVHDLGRECCKQMTRFSRGDQNNKIYKIDASERKIDGSLMFGDDVSWK